MGELMQHQLIIPAFMVSFVFLIVCITTKEPAYDFNDSRSFDQLINTSLKRIKKDRMHADILNDFKKGAYDLSMAKRRQP